MPGTAGSSPEMFILGSMATLVDVSFDPHWCDIDYDWEVTMVMAIIETTMRERERER